MVGRNVDSEDADPRRTVLLVSNRRPGEAGGGRGEKFATRQRLLRERGWRVVVGYVSAPYVLMFLPSLLRCLWVALREDADVVNSVNNPFHLHVVGYLVGLLTRTPWLAELRDPIATHPDRDPDSVVTRAARLVERLVVREADQVVWFDGIQLPHDYFDREYPDLPRARFLRLPPMGYERGKFEAIEPRSYDRFTITYAGSFYEGWIEPYDFLEGLSRYVERTGDEDVLAQFYGDWDPDYQRAVEERGLARQVETHGFVPHEEIVAVMKGSDALLYVGGDDPGNELNLPSKTWDYIGARTPVLAIVDPSFRVADFFREHGLGVVAPTDDPDAVADAIGTLRSGEFAYAPDGSVFDEYTRERSVDRFAEVLDAVDAGRYAGATSKTAAASGPEA